VIDSMSTSNYVYYHQLSLVGLGRQAQSRPIIVVSAAIGNFVHSTEKDNANSLNYSRLVAPRLGDYLVFAGNQHTSRKLHDWANNMGDYRRRVLCCGTSVLSPFEAISPQGESKVTVVVRASGCPYLLLNPA